MIMIVPSFLETKEEELDLKGESFTQMMASAMASLPTPRNAETSFLPLPSSAKERHTGAGAAIVATGVAGTSAVAGAFTHKGGAAKHGVVRTHVARFKQMTPSRFPIPRSPYLTFPPGFNPTTLLDSPVLSTGQQGEPSPTTGTSPLPPIRRGSGSAAARASDPVEKSADQDGTRTFVYRPVPNLGRNELSVHPMAVSKEVPQATPSAPFQDAPNVVASLQMRAPSESIDEASEKAEPGKPPVQVHPPPAEMSSEDGYNWRKYGQKQVKSSKFPRSYYKCAHPNCPVKKKVERSEVVYKGEHDHPKPQATRRISMGPPQAVNGSSRDGIIAVTLRVDGSYEHITDASSMRGQFPNGSSATTKTSEPSLGSTSDDERDGAGGRKPDEGDNDEHNSKRRKKQNAGDAASILPSRTVREPRVVVQTMSDVNILDDGYRWCKYGQKLIKGNPHPRSYYKCHNHGCPVRKHVERSSTDNRAVITTYEGKHNHDAPAARSSSHDSTGSIVTAVTLPHALNASSAMPITRPPPSLQHQYPMGRLLEDRFKGDDRFDGSDVAGARKLAVCTAFIQPGRSQGVSETSVPTSLSFLSPGVNGRLELQGGESFRQGLVLRPKAEPDEDNRVRVLGCRRRP